jgi:hypothetical protein
MSGGVGGGTVGSPASRSSQRPPTSVVAWSNMHTAAMVFAFGVGMVCHAVLSGPGWLQSPSSGAEVEHGDEFVHHDPAGGLPCPSGGPHVFIPDNDTEPRAGQLLRGGGQSTGSRGSPSLGPRWQPSPGPGAVVRSSMTLAPLVLGPGDGWYRDRGPCDPLPPLPSDFPCSGEGALDEAAK